MSGLFDPNGPLMSGLRKMADVILCNILFCLVCCPIVTIGAALTALHASMQLLVADLDEEGDSAIRTFISTFRKNFVPSTALWMVTLAMIAFLIVYHQIVWPMEGMMGRVYRITFFILVLVFLFGFQYFFPIQARFQLRLRDVLKNSWLLSIAAAPWTLLSLAVPAVLVYVTVFMNPEGFQMAVFIWVVGGFGVVTYLDSFFFLRAFRKQGVFYGILEDDSEERTEGALFTDEQHRKEDLMVQESSFSDPDWNRKENPEEEERHRQWVRDTRGRRR